MPKVSAEAPDPANNSASNSTKKASPSLDQDLNLLPADLLLKIYDLMVKTRLLEERLIKIYKAGLAYFWIGAPGEEAFGVPLGLLIHKGQGIEYDWLHLHYRATPTLLAMGMPMIDSIALMMNRVSDPHTGGRNFSNHYCVPKWNVAPVTSPIEMQYSIAIGTAIAQARRPVRGITIVTGGDAGTAEGDFATSLVWASRKGHELPMLITVQNNRWGISTAFEGQHGEQRISDRGKAFGMETLTYNGNDPVESYLKLQEAISYVRKERKPFLLEALVSRLYGHSSASGANWVSDEVDCLAEFEKRLKSADLLSDQESLATRQRYEDEAKQAMITVSSHAAPTPESIWDHIYAGNENGDWRKF